MLLQGLYRPCMGQVCMGQLSARHAMSRASFQGPHQSGCKGHQRLACTLGEIATAICRSAHKPSLVFCAKHMQVLCACGQPSHHWTRHLIGPELAGKDMIFLFPFYNNVRED